MIDITVNHNDDEVTISVSDGEVKRLPIRSTMQVEAVIKHMLNVILDESEEARPDVSLIRIDEDSIKTIDTW